MRIYLYAAIAAVLIGGGILYTIEQRSAGAAAEKARQDKADAAFRVQSTKGAVSFDVCDRAGGLYDFRKNRCVIP